MVYIYLPLTGEINLIIQVARAACIFVAFFVEKIHASCVSSDNGKVHSWLNMNFVTRARDLLEIRR